MISVLVSDRYTTESLTLLEKSLNCQIFKSASNYPTEEELKNADVLLVRSSTRIDEKLLSRAPNLKLVVSATSGVDHIQTKLCEKKSVQWAHTPEANSQSAAETTLMLILQCLKRQRASQVAVDSAQWKSSLAVGNELHRKDVGIIGLGRVGSRVAKMLQAFGANVYAVDPYKEDDHFQKLNVERLGFSEALRQVQILTLHVPLTPETKHMINGRNLSLLPTDAILVNASRGAVVNEGDLTVALEQKIIGGVGLDVFEVEPLPIESRLRQLPQAVLSPHLGAFTEEAFGRASNMAVQKVINYFTK